MALLAPLLASCEQKGPSKILQAEIVSALENVEDKASADEAASGTNFRKKILQFRSFKNGSLASVLPAGRFPRFSHPQNRK